MKRLSIFLVLLWAPLCAFSEEAAISISQTTEHPTSMKTTPKKRVCAGRFNLAASSGYIWKNDKHFKKVYGTGIPDIITFDSSYAFWKWLNVGMKASYWEKSGKTEIRKKHTKIQEVPVILYLKGKMGCVFQGYVSLGGGIIYAHEKSYLGTVSRTAWGLEGEIGANYFFHKHGYLTTAFRYLFFRKKMPHLHETADFGGYGLRAGIGTAF